MSVFTNDVTVEPGAAPIAVDGSGFTQPISAASLPLPTGAATAAGQTQPGVDIGDVTVNNASGASAVNVQDGGNSLTVDGTVAISGSVAVTGPLTDAQLRATPVPISGTVTTTAGVSSTATTTRVATSTTAATALAANANRKQAIITTETGNTYVSLGSTATTTNYAYLLTPTSTLEIPSMWQGTVSVIRNTGTGNIQVVEMV